MLFLYTITYKLPSNFNNMFQSTFWALFWRLSMNSQILILLQIMWISSTIGDRFRKKKSTREKFQRSWECWMKFEPGPKSPTFPFFSPLHTAIWSCPRENSGPNHLEYLGNVFRVALLCYIAQLSCNIDSPADVHVHLHGLFLDLCVQVCHGLRKDSSGLSSIVIQFRREEILWVSL